MKKYFCLLVGMFLISFYGMAQNALPDGNYLIKHDELGDDEFGDIGMLIKNGQVVLTILGTAQTFDLEWIDDDSFVVKGYTESVNPSTFERNQLADYRPSYNITKGENGERFFNLGDQNSTRHIQTGRIVKVD